MREGKLTGNVRFRCHKRLWRRTRLILQVEILENRAIVLPGGAMLDRLAWRDALVEDLTRMRVKGGVK